MNTDDLYKLDKDNFEILKYIYKEPNISQRKLSSILNFSLGKLNYCIKKLIKNRMIEISNSENNNKQKYSYKVTNSGLLAKKNLL